MADFARVPKIDAHLHLHGGAGGFIRQARIDNFKVLSINVDYPDFPSVQQQLRIASSLRRKYPREVAFVATFRTSEFDSPGWVNAVQDELDAAFTLGAVGVKLWKNIGMQLRDASGALVMVDDPRLRPIFTFVQRRGKSVLGHQGEPRNCWLPLSEMTLENDRKYFEEHPQYHMYLHPAMPSHAQQMAARNRLLADHPDMRFVGVHMASLEWSVSTLAQFLDSHPNVNVDLSARIGHLQYQSGRNRDAVRRFMIAYQDRLIYGSDLAQSPQQSERDFAADLHRTWGAHWRYFSTGERQQVAGLDASVRGLSLPKAVIDKLFRQNAEKQYGQAWQR